MKSISVLTPPKIRFGTDGWRAIIGREFTLANVARVAQAYANFLLTANEENGKARKQLKVIVGCDGRALSPEAADMMASILNGNGIKTEGYSLPMPTPVISWSVRNRQAAGGVIVTASHNPPEFNGIKLKSAAGSSVAHEVTAAVEKMIDKNQIRRRINPPTNEECLIGAVGDYRRQIEELVDLNRLRASRSKIVVDSMHGTGKRWIEGFLSGAALEIETIRGEIDSKFGGVNPEPIDSHLGALKMKVRQTNSLLGLATDGDADRFGVVSELGETMTMHEVVPLLLLHLLRNRKLTGGIVATFSQSVLLKRIAAAYNLPFYETPIGFKYIAELMSVKKILLGAEESGGLGISGHIPERDGILSNLLFAEAVIAADSTPSKMACELRREFGQVYFGRCDIASEVEAGKEFVERLARSTPVRAGAETIADVKTLDGTKLLFKDESWILFRQSGTEPVLRIYAETTSPEKVNLLLEAGKNYWIKNRSN